MCGALCVMIPGEALMPLWCVDNWVTLWKVSRFGLASPMGSDNIDTYLIFTDAVAFGNAHFGTGTGAIYLDGVGCTGSESNLTDCSRSSTVSCTYGHTEDAGVRCQGASAMFTYDCSA